MKHITGLVLLLAISHGALSAQQVIAATGNHAASSSGSVSWTIGESITKTLTGTGSILTQGFHQTSLTITIMNELPDPGYPVTVFPNPVSFNAKLRIEKEKFTKMEYLLYDMNGTLLMRKPVEAIETEIPFSTLLPATYILRITKNLIEVKTFKIIKSH